MLEEELERFLQNLKSSVDDTASSRHLLSAMRKELLLVKEGDKSQNKLKFVMEKERNKVPIAFIFGAGISRPEPFSLPSWDELVSRVSLNYFYCSYPISNDCSFEDLEEEFKNNKFFANGDLYELAQYIENNLKTSESINEEIEKIKDRKMYTLVKNSLYNGKSREILGNFKDKYLYRLSNILKKHDVRRVITYNYDDCFEFAYNYQGQDKATPMYTDDMLRRQFDESKNCYVYHVHGYIPYYTLEESGDDYEKDLRDEEINLILSENSYNEIAHSSYKWRNAVQVDTLLKYSCVFMGFSATDKNFKRLINLLYWHEEEGLDDKIDKLKKESKQSQKANHFIFMTVHDYIKQIFGENALKLNQKFEGTSAQIETKGRFLLQVLNDKKNYLLQVKLMPIWTTALDLDSIVREYYEELYPTGLGEL